MREAFLQQNPKTTLKFGDFCLDNGEHLRYYWEYYDPSEPTELKNDPVIGDLADDIADIYRDIMPGLRAWNSVKDELLPEIVFN